MNLTPLSSRPFKASSLARIARFAPLLLAAALLGGCLSDNDAQRRYSNQVVFGDSLSDVGSYSVGAIAAVHGGKFTVNSIPASAQNWSELVAARLDLPAQCAAQTGLEGDPAQGFYAPITEHRDCTNYAQGGARVTEAIGPHNKAIEPELGYLTVPLVTQVRNHLARVGGQFSGSEVVFVFAGGNDFLWQSDALTAGIIAGLAQQINSDISRGACVPTDANGANCIPAAIDNLVTSLTPTYIAAMELAGTQLATVINNEIVGHGARHVVVLNLPDASLSPSARGKSATVKAAVSSMMSAFNGKLAAGLATSQNDSVLQVDLFTRFAAWAANPTAYGFSNFVDTACDLTQPIPNLLGSSITCNTTNTVAGDVSRYAFADNVHPSPYTNTLLADVVLSDMAQRGWR